MSLRQHLDLRVQDRSKSYMFDIVTREVSGVQAGKVSEALTTSIQLPARQTGDYIALKASGRLKDTLVKEPAFSNSAAPSTDGVLVGSKHILTVTAYMEGCGSENIQVQLPCYISHPEYEILNTAEQPNDWQPKIFDVVI